MFGLKGPSLAEEMVEAVRPVCPIDHSTLIDGRDAQDGIIRPNLDPSSRAEDLPVPAFIAIANSMREAGPR